MAALLASSTATPDAIYAAMKPHLADPSPVAAGNYQIDLNLTGIPKNTVPAYVWPRLSANKDGKPPIPLYSDLRLHFMGKALADNDPHPTDGIYAAQPGVYVTRVLRGIHDTAPYLHDGRARTLAEAIMMHGARRQRGAAGVPEVRRAVRRGSGRCHRVLGQSTAVRVAGHHGH